MDNSGLQYDSPQVCDYKKFYDFVFNSVVISVLPSHSVLLLPLNGEVQNILLHVQLVPKSTIQLQFIWSRCPNTSNFQDYSLFLSLPPEFSIKSFSG